MPNYTSTLNNAIQINVDYAPLPFGASGDHAVNYRGTTLAASAYSGDLHYSIHGHELHIHSMNAQPQGASLGSLLLWETILHCQPHGILKVVALNVAANARGFYLRSRMHPSQSGRQLNQAFQQQNAPVGPIPQHPVQAAQFRNFGTNWLLARNVADYEGTPQSMLQATMASWSNHWQ